MSAVTVNLTGKLAEFVEDRVASGEYDSATDVVHDAVRLLSDDYDRKLTALRAAIAEGTADVEAGRISNRSARQIAEDIVRRARG